MTDKSNNLTRSYQKNKPIWEFIYKFIEDNSNHLHLLRAQKDNDDRFFAYLSKLLIDKLSNNNESKY